MKAAAAEGSADEKASAEGKDGRRSAVEKAATDGLRTAGEKAAADGWSGPRTAGEKAAADGEDGGDGSRAAGEMAAAAGETALGREDAKAGMVSLGFSLGCRGEGDVMDAARWSNG